MFDRQSLHIAMLLWGCIFSMLAALCMFMSKNFDREKRFRMILMQLCCAVLLGSDAIAWRLRGASGTLAFYGVRISNFMVFILSDALLLLYHDYMCCYLFGTRMRCVQMDNREENSQVIVHRSSRKKKRIPRYRIYAVYSIAILGMIMVVVSQYTDLYYYIDEMNFYHRNKAYILSLCIPLCGMLMDFSILFQYRKNITRRIFVAMVSYIALPCIAMIILVFYYGISLTNIAICISMILMFVIAMVEQNENLASKEKEAADMRIAVMMSQITPHFLFNSLTTIRGLCRSNPEVAGETVEQFSEYLRGNLDSLSEKEPIPFERELKHVRCYLAIEQRRFQDRIHVEYAVQDEDFLLPALTLQPLVENAVKHGLCKKPGGGTVSIETVRTAEKIAVIVEDDGVGFNVNEKANDNQVHVGLENVKNRIESMCGGTLCVDSQKGKGTRVVITIPQHKE